MDISSMTPGRQVKLQYWLNIIHECRTSDLTNQAWCEQNGACLPASSDPSSMTQAPGDFAEVPLPVSCSPSDNPTAILQIRNISVELFDQTSPELLVSILKTVQSCLVTFPVLKKSTSALDIRT